MNTPNDKIATKMTRQRTMMVPPRCSVLVLLLALLPHVSAQSVMSPRDLERRLKNMSNQELEEICIERGFELITDELDDETGLPVVSTHQDYIDAAIQCIQMEDVVVNDLYEKGEEGTPAPPISRHSGMQDVALEDNNNNIQRGRLQQMQIMADHLIPLPKPVKRLLGRLLVRLAKDGTELVLFVRRQFDAIVGAVRDRITEGRQDRILEERLAQRRNREQAVNYDL